MDISWRAIRLCVVVHESAHLELVQLIQGRALQNAVP